jgi:DNA topoisomerase IA
MALTTFVVEAPGKEPYLKSILKEIHQGPWAVVSTRGRLYDLPRHEIGIDIKTHTIQKLFPIQKDKLELLRSSFESSDRIYIMTDDDDEGEWIADQVNDIAIECKVDHVLRCPLKAMTKEAVSESIKNPRVIDEARVNGAKARRILDREIGYLFSLGHINKGRHYHAPAPVGRVISPVLNYLIEQSKAQVSGKFSQARAGLITAYIIRELPSTDNKGPWNAVVSCPAGTCPKAVADKLAAFNVIDIMSASESEIEKYTPDGRDWLEFMSKDMEKPISEISQGLQSAYEEGHVTYHRSDSTHLSEEYRSRLLATASKLGVKLDLGKLEGKNPRYKKSITDRYAHEATIPLSPPKLEIPRKSLSERDQLLSSMWGAYISMGRTDELVVREHGRPIDSADEGYWKQSLFPANVRFFREYREINARTRKQKGIFQSTEGLPLGNKTHTGVRLVPVPGDRRIFEIMRHLNLGRPSTISDHATKIANLYLDDLGRPNGKAKMAVERAKSLVPELLDETIIASMEAIIFSDDATLSAEKRVEAALKVANIADKWPKEELPATPETTRYLDLE